MAGTMLPARNESVIVMQASSITVMLALFFTTLAYTPAGAYDQAYSQASSDAVEVLELPPARWLAAGATGRYFERSGMLFGQLFDFISSHDIEMTVPVEGRLDRAQMRFFLSPGTRASGLSDSVKIVTKPKRSVARLGGSGSYSAQTIAPVRARVEAWIAQHPTWQASGPAYAVFWNGPLTPWFLKRFEVHVTVERAEDAARVSNIGKSGAS